MEQPSSVSRIVQTGQSVVNPVIRSSQSFVRRLGWKWIIRGGIVLVVIVLIFLVSQIRVGDVLLAGEKEAAKLGTLIIPVTATGTVQGNKLIQIKSKAGGQVAKIHVVEGQLVKTGDTLIELDPVDEKRNVEARQADLDRAKGAHEKAKIALESQKLELPLQTQRAQAAYDKAAFDWARMKEFKEKGIAGNDEYVLRKSNFELADADLKTAKNNETILIRNAEQDVVQAEAAMRSAQKLMDEATLRLEETVVKARSPGMVYSIQVREGEMIQSGTQSFTGGTPVMVLVDTTAVLVIAQVDEADIGAIRNIAPDYARPGTSVRLDDEEYAKRAESYLAETLNRKVEVTVEAYRGQVFDGVIERILPEPKRVNNALAFDVRVRLVGEDLQHLIGLQADLAFTTQQLENVLLVKNEALVSEGRDCFVYVPVRIGSGRWDEEKRPVRISVTDGTYTQIVSGLKAGDEVWTKRPRKTEKERQESERN
ncbi:MAG TPA: HlyD family efflux transporter periplasmic adaptor subunit [Phycisphaerae bacterium]|nr:HlyD family efflux transporter periplasmic adaptor subunit [Phycisphaerae bacterium]